MDYIIYTTEGYTQTPNGEDIENCQILDIQYNSCLSKQECLKQYLIENPTNKIGFNKYETKVVVGMSDAICHSMKEMVSFIQKRKAEIQDGEIAIHLDNITKYFNL